MRKSAFLNRAKSNHTVPWRRIQALCLAYSLFFSAVLAGAHALPAFEGMDASLHQIICGAGEAPDQTPNPAHNGRDLPCCVPAISAVLLFPILHTARIDGEGSRLNSWLPAFHNPVAGYPPSAPGMLRAPPAEV